MSALPSGPTATVTHPAPGTEAHLVAGLAGPRPWPVLGNLLQFDLPRLPPQMEAWAGQYGPAYRLRIGPREALVVPDAEVIATEPRERLSFTMFPVGLKMRLAERPQRSHF